MNGIIRALCMASLIAASQDYRNFQLVAVTANSNESRTVLHNLYHKGFGGMIFLNIFEPDEHDIHVIVNQEMKKILANEMKKFGLKLKVLNVSVDSLVKRTLPIIEETFGKREDTEKYNYLQYEPAYKIYNEIKRFADTFEKYATLIRLGESSEDREMLALKISNTLSSGRIIFIQCGIHAREWISHATCMFLIKELLTLIRTKSSKKSARTARRYDWVILPVFNVDGYVYSHETDRFWRKSRSKTTNPNCKGVDLNRNWPFHFGILGPHSSASPCSSVYRGSGPSSEIEVKNVLSYLKSIQSNLLAFYDLHSYGQDVLYPWAYSSMMAPDAFELSLIAQKSSNAMKNVHGHRYATGTPSSLLYSVGGSSMDYVYGKLGVKYSFTMELRGKSSVINFLLPPDQIKPQGEEVLAAILAAAEKFKF